MTFIHRDNDIPMGRCAKCDADLGVRDNRRARKALHFCTNSKCVFYRKKPHPAGAFLNEGKKDK